MTDVEEFISHFNFSYGDGNCFWFAFILFTRFSPVCRCDIMYNPIDNHFATWINGCLYDGTGKISLNEEWITWKEFLLTDPLELRRIYRDCIFQVSEEEWDSFPGITTKYPWDFIP